jgi:hypothetical protein
MSPQAGSTSTRANVNSHLLGMMVYHLHNGIGTIVSTYGEHPEYCAIQFPGYTSPIEFRIDLLGGWGGFFKDCTEEINRRRTSVDESNRINSSSVSNHTLAHDNGSSATNNKSLIQRLADLQHIETSRVKEVLHERRIQYALHFTRIENLPSILKNGLLPRSELVTGTFRPNDEVRADGLPEANCLSISFPNYKMLYKYSMNSLTPYAGWAVLAIDPVVFAELPCLYFPTNAAASECAYTSRVNPMQFSGAAALNAMFADPAPGVRARNQLPDHFTTDPQAEVLVFAKVPTKYLRALALDSKSQEANKYAMQALLRNLPVELISDTRWFGRRHDSAYWHRRRITQMPFELEVSHG